VLSEACWEAAQRGAFDQLPPELLEQLRKDEFVVPEDENELAQVIRQNERAVEVHDVLYQVVQPSAWCQLDCGYCGQEHSKQQLGLDDQAAFVARVEQHLKSGRYRVLDIGWFGAEPLAGLNVIRSLTRKLSSLVKDHACGYSARIVTNGMTLTPTIARELVEALHVREAEVTLDGPAHLHDARRGRKGGGASFARIFANLRAVARHTRLGLVVRCNVDRENADGVSLLLEQLAGEGLQERIRFYTAPVHAWGNDAHRGALAAEEYAEWELEWLCLQMRLGFRVGLLPARKKIVCMAVRPDAEVIDATGASYNCTEVSYVPSYGRPNLFAIRLPGVPLRTSPPAERLANFNAEILSGEQASCHACRMLPVCGGQCPKSWHEGHEACPSPKRNMPQRLNLLYAQSLQARVSNAESQSC
jgi:uncharacterized protein